MQNRSLTGKIIGATIEVHTQLGPGLLERVYEDCLHEELILQGHSVKHQCNIPIFYKGKKLGSDLRIDLLVDDQVIVEIKSTLEVHPVFKSQLLTYLKLSDCRLGLLINFNVPKLVDGVTRVSNGYQD